MRRLLTGELLGQQSSKCTDPGWSRKPARELDLEPGEITVPNPALRATTVLGIGEFLVRQYELRDAPDIVETRAQTMMQVQ